MCTKSGSKLEYMKKINKTLKQNKKWRLNWQNPDSALNKWYMYTKIDMSRKNKRENMLNKLKYSEWIWKDSINQIYQVEMDY